MMESNESSQNIELLLMNNIKRIQSFLNDNQQLFVFSFLIKDAKKRKCIEELIPLLDILKENMQIKNYRRAILYLKAINVIMIKVNNVKINI